MGIALGGLAVVGLLTLPASAATAAGSPTFWATSPAGSTTTGPGQSVSHKPTAAVQDGYIDPFSAASATVDATEVVPKVTCTAAQDNEGAYEYLQQFLLGYPTGSTVPSADTVMVAIACPSSTASQPTYAVGASVDSGSYSAPVDVVPGTTLKVVIKMTTKVQTATVTGTGVNVTQSTKAGLTPAQLQVSYQVSDAPAPAFGTVAISGLKINGAAFVSFTPITMDDIPHSTLGPLTAKGTAFTITDTA